MGPEPGKRCRALIEYRQQQMLGPDVLMAHAVRDRFRTLEQPPDLAPELGCHRVGLHLLAQPSILPATSRLPYDTPESLVNVVR
jgi:hypothetical protein